MRGDQRVHDRADVERAEGDRRRHRQEPLRLRGGRARRALGLVQLAEDAPGDGEVALPASVSLTERVVRRSSGVPTRASSASMARVIDAEERWRARAAADKLPRSTVSTKA
ncbi:MAG: hypothetical protein U0359_30120 [Byssovorax sp.]